MRKVVIAQTLVVVLTTILLLSACTFSPIPSPKPSSTASSASPTSTNSPSPNIITPIQPDYLVLISLDACRPEYLDLAPLPHLRELMDSGMIYREAWVGALVSNTPPGHVEISTGTLPKHNGILSFGWRDPVTGNPIKPTTLEAINRGELARIVAEHGVPTLATLYKALYPDRVVAAVSAQKFYAAQGLGMGSTDYILYAKQQAGEDLETNLPQKSPSLIATEVLVPTALTGHEPPAAVMQDPRLRVPVETPGDENAFVLQAALVLWETVQPGALLLNLPATDEYGHRTGGICDPATMRQVMETTDEALGQLIDAYRQAGLFDRTLWVITADHGMIPNAQQIDPQQVKDLAHQAGIRGQVGWPYCTLDDTSQAATWAETLAQGGISGVRGAFAKEQNDDAFRYQPSSSTQTHLAAEQIAAYQYLLDSFVGPESPDVVVITAENTLEGTAPLSSRGAHGEVTWGDQHIPLILAGPGVLQGTSDAPARLVDMLPTLSRLIGFPTEGMDGVVLADTLRYPNPTDISRQQDYTEQVAPLQQALREVSAVAPISSNTPTQQRVERNVPYGRVDGVSLTMDLYFPSNATGATSAVLYVHGGGWTKGSKSSGVGLDFIPELITRGTLVAAIDYRLAPEYKFPAQIEDVMCAVRFLRAHAADYNLDPDRIGAIGGSAGGHLVALLGTVDTSAPFSQTSGGWNGVSSLVQAVVDLFGPSDLQAMLQDAPSRQTAQQVFGTSDLNSAMLAQASPVTYISPDDPPFLILYGEKDRLVSPSQSQELYDKLQAAGVPATLVLIKNAGHGLAPTGGAIIPTRAELVQRVADFFDAQLQ